MPGFNISNSQGQEDRQKLDRGAYRPNSFDSFIYNYVWEIEKLFGHVIKDTSPLVYLRDCTLPTVTIEKETYTASSLQYKFASAIVYDDIKCTFYDTYNLLPILKIWREHIWTEDGGLQTANNYKYDTSIVVFGPDGVPYQRYTLYGSWPSMIKYGDLTYTSSDAKFVDLTITYDWIKEEKLELK